MSIEENLVDSKSPAPITETLTLSFDGQTKALFFLVAKNLLLTLVSLGIYYPWARNAKRKFMLQHLKLGDQRFVYTGTGQELFFGYAKLLVLGGALYAGLIYAQTLVLGSPWLGFALLSFIVGCFIILGSIATWGGWAYRLSRTRYRGIAFSLDPSNRSGFIKKNTLYGFLLYPTFMLILPTLLFQTRKGIYQEIRYGTLAFSYKGRLKDSYWLSIKNFFLSYFTLGIYFPRALVKRLRFEADAVVIGDSARFRVDHSGLDMFVSVIFPMIINTLSFGLAYPWIGVWGYRRFLSKVRVEGSIDFASIRPLKQDPSATGESLSELFSLDAGFGV